MAAQLKLVTRPDLGDVPGDDVSEVDLLPWLAENGWIPGIGEEDKPVDEVLTVHIPGDDIDDMIANVQTIDAKMKEIKWSRDSIEPLGVWLRAQLADETNMRQAYLTGGKRSQGASVNDMFLKELYLKAYQLGLTRMPLWEADTPVVVAPANPISIHGGLLPYTIAGDAAARVAQVKLSGGPVGSSNYYSEAWLGVKSNLYGCDPDNFEPVWNLDLGTQKNDTSIVVDATALDGNKIVCTFATNETLDYRALMSASTITAYLTDQRGKYNVLLRAKTSDSSLEANVRVGQGYLSYGLAPRSFAWQPRYQITAADAGWRYYTLGQIQIPAAASFFDSAFSDTAIGIQAEKVAGTGDLEMDSLILIPAEHAVHVYASEAGFGYSTVDLYVFTRPGGRCSAVTYKSVPPTTVYETPTPDAIDWSIPPGDGVIVCAGSRSVTTLSDTFTPSLSIYPSYATLRGAG